MQIQTGPSRKELKSHGGYDFPVLVSHEYLSLYETGSFLWHWHPEIELTLVISGSICYQVNEESFHLRAGQALFGNSNTLHTGKTAAASPAERSLYSITDIPSSKGLSAETGRDCHYLSVTFDPRLLYGFEGSLIQTSCVLPVILNTDAPAICFDRSQEWHGEIIDALSELEAADASRQTGYEMEILLHLCRIWLSMIRRHPRLLSSSSGRNDKNLSRIREMMTFIQGGYASRISLEDIASHVHLCKSECCRTFKRYMKISLFDYLLQYRIEKSLPLLTKEGCTVTEAALACGFSDPNYFSKVFRRFKGCPPSAYPEQIRL